MTDLEARLAALDLRIELLEISLATTKDVLDKLESKIDETTV